MRKKIKWRRANNNYHTRSRDASSHHSKCTT